MLTRYFIAIDTKEKNSKGERLLLPISPPVKLLKELIPFTAVKTYDHLYKIWKGICSDGSDGTHSKEHVGVCVVWLEDDEDEDNIDE
jgi:hypothetical protein